MAAPRWAKGLMIKVARWWRDVFAVPIEKREDQRDRAPDKVPNTSATAASSGADLNGLAAKNAGRDDPRAAHCLRRDPGWRARLELRRALPPRPSRPHPLAATGFLATPKIHYDRATHRGRPFLLFRLWRGLRRS
jgi:xanthine dehydrogenase large subunit